MLSVTRQNSAPIELNSFSGGSSTLRPSIDCAQFAEPINKINFVFVFNQCSRAKGASGKISLL